MEDSSDHCLADDVLLLEHLRRFDRVHLPELDRVRLLNRKDTKHVFHIKQLGALLARINADYRVLEMGGKTVFPYQSEYYDTQGFRMYLDQHNGRTSRYKVRTRTYLDSGQSYIEVKFKDNKDHTHKVRSELGKTSIAEFVEKHTPYRFSDLEPTLTTRFSRSTLVDKAFSERITIDTRLSYFVNGDSCQYPELVILELKQDRSARKSPLSYVLRDERILPMRLGKYCLGITTHHSQVKQNRYKEKARYIQRIMAEYG